MNIIEQTGFKLSFSFELDDIRRHAGHAHWQNIAKTKSANDQLKGRVIGKLATKIVSAIRRKYFGVR